ncbi:DUF6082 family protein [Streptomyces sp. NPDC059010]|uniref:DUF6082 family protein n=1 Tax=Streptomyces sp. NPDC059010 TaxID=3346695 RepID=UPI0036C6C807
MSESKKDPKRSRVFVHVGVAVLATLIIAAVLWGPWILDDPYLRDQNGNLSSSAGTIITGLRTSIVALAAATIAAIGVRYTHRTLEHTREKDLRQQAEEGLNRYRQLVHDHDIGLLLKAVENDDVADAIDTYAVSFSAEDRRKIVVCDAQYKNVLLAYRGGVMPLDEFIGRVRALLQNHYFQMYWDASRDRRRSLPEDAVESSLGLIVDRLKAELDESSDEEWWAVGAEEPRQAD